MSEKADLLVGDVERAAAVDELRRHYDAGRLTLEEFEERLATIHRARAESDLRAAFDRLPDAKRPTLGPRDVRWRSLAVQYALVNVIALLVWLFTGAAAQNFWPKWVFLATLIVFVRRALGRGGRGDRRALPPATDPGDNR
jgi:hypothetical protein